MRSLPHVVSLLLLGAALPAQSLQYELVKDIHPEGGSGAAGFIDCNGTVYFSADDGKAGVELWKSDGTAQGTVLVKDIHAGPQGSGPRELAVCGRLLFFLAYDGVHGEELWATDGSVAGTRMVKDILAGNGSSSPHGLVCLGDVVLFAADDGTGEELFKSDGTAAGTVMVKDIHPVGGSQPSGLVSHGGVVYLAADDGAHGAELWRSDGTATGTYLVADIAAGSLGSSPASFAFAGGQVFFAADDGASDRELWRSDGTSQGTSRVKDVWPGASGSGPKELTSCEGKVFFIAVHPDSGQEVWVTDGTAAGTVLTKDIGVGNWSFPEGLVCCNGLVFFKAADGFHPNGRGFELWRSDGTAAGTWLVKDIEPGWAGSDPVLLTRVGRRIYFAATTQAHGSELWRSDGTEAGTTLVCDLDPGANGSWPSYLTLSGGKLFWRGSHPTYYHEPFVIRLPGASVTLAGQPCPPHYPSLDATPPVLGATCKISGESAPQSHVGVLLLAPKAPAPIPVPPRCFAHNDPTTFLLLGTLLPPAWTRQLGIPSSPALNGVLVVLQAWWIKIPDGTLSLTHAAYLGLGS